MAITQAIKARPRRSRASAAIDAPHDPASKTQGYQAQITPRACQNNRILREIARSCKTGGCTRFSVIWGGGVRSGGHITRNARTLDWWVHGSSWLGGGKPARSLRRREEHTGCHDVRLAQMERDLGRDLDAPVAARVPRGALSAAVAAWWRCPAAGRAPPRGSRSGRA